MNKVFSVAENETIRSEILEICAAAQPYGAGTKVVKAALKKTGYELSEEEILSYAGYLQDKGLVRINEIGNSRLDLQRHIISITAKGVDVLEGNEAAAGIGD